MIRSIARKALMPTLLALAIAPLSLAASADSDTSKAERYQQKHAERLEAMQEHREAMQERLTALVDSWELSEEERTTLSEVRESLYQDIRELRTQQFADRDERRAAYRELRDEHHAALSELLSDEQLEELKAAMKPTRDGWHGKRDHRHARNNA